jgi:DNA transformation protein
MTASREFADFVVEQMAAFARVRAKRMFGGYGLYRDELMFALIVDDQLYLKADDDSVAAFRARDLPPFTYESRGRTVALRYYAAPPEVFDAPDEMHTWARRAWECAVRARRG